MNSEHLSYEWNEDKHLHVCMKQGAHGCIIRNEIKNTSMACYDKAHDVTARDFIAIMSLGSFEPTCCHTVT
jgi:hypothetical protein